MQENNLIGNIVEMYYIEIVHKNGTKETVASLGEFSGRDDVIRQVIDLYNKTCQEVNEGDQVILASSISVDTHDGWVDMSPTYNVIAKYSSKVVSLV